MKKLLFIFASLLLLNSVAMAQNEVIYDPEGEDVTYTLNCIAQSNYYSYGTYIGAAHVRYAADGVTCYIKDITPTLKLGSWVKGTIDGDIITIPADQLVYAGYDTAGEYFELHFLPEDINMTTYEHADLTEFKLQIVGDHLKSVSSSQFAVVTEKGNGAYEYAYNHDYGPYEGVETIDEIITDPQGELTNYAMACDIYTATINKRYGSMRTKMITDEKGMVYFNTLLPGYGKVWVRGTKLGNKISIPSYQAIEYLADTDETVYFATYENNKYVDNAYELIENDGKLTPINEYAWTAAVPITEGVISLPFAYSWGYELTRVDEDPVTIPEGLEKFAYTLTAVTSTSSNRTVDAELALDGNKVYISGLLQNTPSVVLVGELQGNEIHIPSRQLLADDTYYYRFMCGNASGSTYNFKDEMVLTLEDGFNTIKAPSNDFSITCYEDATTVLKAWKEIKLVAKGATPSGVNSVNAEQKESKFFDLQGRRIFNPQKGIYIKDGKKVMY